MTDRLLNTAEAAKFLRVSEASIRRWSDSGLLPVRRVGRRRERRFSHADLDRFLIRAPGREEAAVSAVNLGGTRVPLHAHLATFYNSDGGRLRLSVPFFVDGLRAGQPCFLAAEGAILDAYLDALRAHGVDVDAARASGRLVTADGPGHDVEEALAFWEQELWQRLESGPTVLRLVGEMASERRQFPSDAEMIRYELAFTGIAKRFPTVTVCQYDVREFGGETIFQAMRAHPDLYEHHLGSFLN